MADNGSRSQTGGQVDQDLNDPILQGADRVQDQVDVEENLSPEEQEGTQDTHTRTNIHLGGRNDEGKGTGIEEVETVVPPQAANFQNPSPKHYPVPENDPIGPQSEGFKTTPGIDPDDPNYPSIGRATPQVNINTQNSGPLDPSLHVGRDGFFGEAEDVTNPVIGNFRPTSADE